MAGEENSEIFEDDFNKYIQDCFRQNVYVWHVWQIESGTFNPAYSIDQAVAFCHNRAVIADARVIRYDYSRAHQYMQYFNGAFSLMGAVYPELYTPVLVVPIDVETDVTSFLSQYGLTKYIDLVWHLLFRLQVMYTQRIHYNVVNEDYTTLIRSGRKNTELLIELIKYYLFPNENNTIRSVSISVQTNEGVKLLNDQFLARFKSEEIVEAGIYGLFNGRLTENWQEEMLNADASHTLQMDFKYIHRKFSNAFVSFLQGTGLVVEESNLSYKYLKPIAAMLNLSEYPFNKSELDVKNIQSLLKNQQNNN